MEVKYKVREILLRESVEGGRRAECVEKGESSSNVRGGEMGEVESVGYMYVFKKPRVKGRRC